MPLEESGTLEIIQEKPTLDVKIATTDEILIMVANEKNDTVTPKENKEDSAMVINSLKF